MSTDDRAGDAREGANPRITYSLLGGLGVILIAAVAVLLIQNSNQASDIDDLNAAVETLQDPEATATSEARIKKLTRTVGKLERCLPELQNQLNTLEVTAGFVSPTDQLSTECSSIIYPSLAQGD